MNKGTSPAFRSAFGLLAAALIAFATPAPAQTEAPQPPAAPAIEGLQAPQAESAPASPAISAEEAPATAPAEAASPAESAEPSTEPANEPAAQDSLEAAPEAGEAAAAPGEETASPMLDPLKDVLPEAYHAEVDFLQSATDNSLTFLRDGGPSIWAIALLSVITMAVILWKIWRLALIGAWSKGAARKAVGLYETGRFEDALACVQGRRGLRSKVVSAAIAARRDLSDEDARAETGRVAKRELAEASTGLRMLELIATIAPLLGLLGTVLGMIAAFQALQEAGSRADPALLAGGIWEALLTTAAGMAVAIPASAALTWFEAVIDRMRRDVEDAATRIFIDRAPQGSAADLASAAE